MNGPAATIEIPMETQSPDPQDMAIVHHFRLYFFAAVSHVIAQCALSFGGREALLEQFPFLNGYITEMTVLGMQPDSSVEADWQAALRSFEQQVHGHLPLRALRDTGIDLRSTLLLVCIGLGEEDPRFGHLFECMHGIVALRRPTVGLLNAWWRQPVDQGEVRACLRSLQDAGLIVITNTESPRLERGVEVPAMVWDALRGEAATTPLPWLQYVPITACSELSRLVLDDSIVGSLRRAPEILRDGELDAIVVRGSRHSGRRTYLLGVARALGRGALLARMKSQPTSEQTVQLGTLAILLHALPILMLDTGIGETVEVLGLGRYRGPLAVALGKHGGVWGEPLQRVAIVTIPLPDIALRLQHWRAALRASPCPPIDALAERYRLHTGYIHRLAVGAIAQAALAGRKEILLADVQLARRTEQQALGALSVRLAGSCSWNKLVVPASTQRDLRDLERRCRHRERLHALHGARLGGQRGVGVRALLQGPSGTGKTLAAQVLAVTLEMDLYRVDLAAVVSKYIGETEKNLGELFRLAEELDVILLFDEGDALLAQRTSVQSSNDRYANLETNYLLQRIESFEGILLITTNAGEHIDRAFVRRMDAVIEFRAPEAEERWAIWQLHLPTNHAIERDLLHEVAGRCVLNGGQIRNAATHAVLLALDEGVSKTVRNEHLIDAVEQEYRKSGVLCPLRQRRTHSA